MPNVKCIFDYALFKDYFGEICLLKQKKNYMVDMFFAIFLAICALTKSVVVLINMCLPSKQFKMNSTSLMKRFKQQCSVRLTD